MEPKRVSVCVLLNLYLRLTSSSDVFYQLHSPTPLVINFNRSSFTEFYDCLACTTGCSCSMATEDYEVFNLTLNPNAGSTVATFNVSLPNYHYCMKHCSLELASTSKPHLRFWRINCTARPTNETCFFDVGVKGFNLLLCWISNTSFIVTFVNSTHLQGDCITRNMIDLQSMNEILESTGMISFRGSGLTSESSLYLSWPSSLINDHNVPTLLGNLTTISTTVPSDVVLVTSVALLSRPTSELNEYFETNTKPYLITSFTPTLSLSRLSVIATQSTSLLTNESTSKSNPEMSFTYFTLTPVTTYAVTPFQIDRTNNPPKSRTIIIILCTVIGILLLTFSIVIYYLVRKRLRRKAETESLEIYNLNGGIGTPVKTKPSNSDTGHYSTIRPSSLPRADLQPYNISSRKSFPGNSYHQDNPKSNSTSTSLELLRPRSSRPRPTSKHKPGDADASIYDTIDRFSEEASTEETMNSDLEVRPNTSVRVSSVRVSSVRPYSVVTLAVAQDPSSTSRSTKMIQFKDKYFYLTHSDIGQYASDKSSDTTVYNESHKSQSNSSGCETLSADGSFQYIVRKHPSDIDGYTEENNSMNNKFTTNFPYSRLNELNRSFQNVYSKGL
ncbi:uncharacterized protein LOC106072529 [Biomphalaria glabrata]|uniref:Uncharacterized protein LOC106072529 n=1 Tax=Biomphalaria glabrata TaxID=6526 RepID=A0A9U8EHY4_BIOGL|nr:uncharacterized protein LOC106072529 [Biomphalaria glabrata]